MKLKSLAGSRLCTQVEKLEISPLNIWKGFKQGGDTDKFALHSRVHIGSNVKNGMDGTEEESEQVRDDFSSQGKNGMFEDCSSNGIGGKWIRLRTFWKRKQVGLSSDWIWMVGWRK